MESCNFASILTGEKVVVSIHNNPLKKHNWYERILIRYLYKFPNVLKVIAVSKGIEKILTNKFNLKNTKVIYNPINFSDCKEKGKIKYKNYILAVGRLHYQKNYELLLKSFKNTKAIKYTKLLIAGEGPERKKLEALIDLLDLRGKVILLGQVSNIEDYYNNASMFVLSSRYEGFGNVIAEALSYSCACIATNCPTGPSEIIANEQNGLLVENENQDALTKAIDRLYFDEELKNKFRKNARKSIEHLKLENITKKWLSL